MRSNITKSGILNHHIIALLNNSKTQGRTAVVATNWKQLVSYGINSV